MQLVGDQWKSPDFWKDSLGKCWGSPSHWRNLMTSASIVSSSNPSEQRLSTKRDKAWRSRRRTSLTLVLSYVRSTRWAIWSSTRSKFLQPRFCCPGVDEWLLAGLHASKWCRCPWSTIQLLLHSCSIFWFSSIDIAFIKVEGFRRRCFLQCSDGQQPRYVLGSRRHFCSDGSDLNVREWSRTSSCCCDVNIDDSRFRWGYWWLELAFSIPSKYWMD